MTIFIVMNYEMKLLTLISAMLLLLAPFANGQDPDEKKDAPTFEVVATPYLWLPWISGSLSVDKALKDFQSDISATPVDLLSNLRAAAMFHGQFSKGHFVSDVDYLFMILKAEETRFTSQSGEDLVMSGVKLTGHVAELTLGGRIEHGIVVFDPYAGVRYTFFRTEANLATPNKQRDKSVNLWFFDALIGGRLTLYPHPKVPLKVQGDVGGFGGGSKLSWSAEVSAGYSVSRLVDLFAGFKAWSFEYTKDSNEKSMDALFYGFEIGASFFLPKRTAMTVGGKTEPGG